MMKNQPQKGNENQMKQSPRTMKGSNPPTTPDHGGAIKPFESHGTHKSVDVHEISHNPNKGGQADYIHLNKPNDGKYVASGSAKPFEPMAEGGQ
jgi:hypothetical protein